MNNHMVWNHGDLLLIVKDVELGQTLKIQKESHGLEPWFRHCINIRNDMVQNHGN